MLYFLLAAGWGDTLEGVDFASSLLLSYSLISLPASMERLLGVIMGDYGVVLYLGWFCGVFERVWWGGGEYGTGFGSQGPVGNAQVAAGHGTGKRSC